MTRQRIVLIEPLVEDGETYLPVVEAARQFAYTYSHVQSLSQLGLLRRTKRTGRLYVSETDLRAWSDRTAGWRCNRKAQP